MLESLSSADTWIALCTLTAMEIVLGVDNVIFIAILTGRLPPEKQGRIRTIGLVLALGMRLGLLLAITWIMGLTATLFTMFGHGFTGRDLILLGGGLFLIGKASHEMFEKLEGGGADHGKAAAVKSGAAGAILVQIVLLDIVFSLDSVITAVGMAQQVWIMVVAMVVSSAVMLFAAPGIAGFVERHPSMKVLALSFLLLIGVLLVGDGLGHHLPKGYVYFAMAYAVFVEILNMRLRKVQEPVPLHGPEEEAGLEP